MILLLLYINIIVILYGTLYRWTLHMVGLLVLQSLLASLYIHILSGIIYYIMHMVYQYISINLDYGLVYTLVIPVSNSIILMADGGGQYFAFICVPLWISRRMSLGTVTVEGGRNTINILDTLSYILVILFGLFITLDTLVLVAAVIIEININVMVDGGGQYFALICVPLWISHWISWHLFRLIIGARMTLDCEKSVDITINITQIYWYYIYYYYYIISYNILLGKSSIIHQVYGHIIGIFIIFIVIPEYGLDYGAAKDLPSINQDIFYYVSLSIMEWYQVFISLGEFIRLLNLFIFSTLYQVTIVTCVNISQK